MISLDEVKIKANQRWKNLSIWQPLVVSICIILVLAICHRTYWELTTNSNTQEIWENRILSKDGENWEIDFEQNVGDTITFKGVLETSPKNEVFQDIGEGYFIEDEALVYTEDLKGKTFLNLGGIRILINSNLTDKFFRNEVVTIEATLIKNETKFNNGTANITLVREGWEASVNDIKLASDIDRYFFGLEAFILIIGLLFSLRKVDNLANRIKIIWHLTRFEFWMGVKSSRMIILGFFFSVFIIGMGWTLGTLQNSDGTFGITNSKEALSRLSFFTFWVISLTAIAMSVDSFHKERQTNTLNLLLSRPITHEEIVIGKALGLTMIVGIPALLAQIIGMYLMITEGEAIPTNGVIAYFIFGIIMIFTYVTFQICLSLNAKSGTDVILYGIGAWLIFTIGWLMILTSVSIIFGDSPSSGGFEEDSILQITTSYMELLNPGYVYTHSVNLMCKRPISVATDGIIPGWLVLLALVLWPLACLRVSTWLFKREMKG